MPMSGVGMHSRPPRQLSQQSRIPLALSQKMKAGASTMNGEQVKDLECMVIRRRRSRMARLAGARGTLTLTGIEIPLTVPLVATTSSRPVLRLQSD
jgi:hypothetical protein